MSTTAAVKGSHEDKGGGDRAFFGQPKGLGTLFFVELWERFSYYGMRAILLYFLIATTAEGGLGIDETTGTAVVTIYGASVYLLSIIGGFTADRMFGPRRSTLYGALVIMAGHICLVDPGFGDRVARHRPRRLRHRPAQAQHLDDGGHAVQQR